METNAPGNEKNGKEEKTNWGKVLNLVTIAVILGGLNWAVWFTAAVPDNIPPRTITQALLSATSIIFLVLVIVVVKKKWL